MRVPLLLAMLTAVLAAARAAQAQNPRLDERVLNIARMLRAHHIPEACG